MGFLFSSCESLEILPDISKWNTDKVKNMCGFLSECPLLTSLPDLSKWFNKPDIKDENIAYYLNKKKMNFKLDIKHSMSEINYFIFINLSYMFYNCSSLKSLPDISTWNTENVILIKGIFSNCSSLKSLPDISKWNTDNMIDISEIFLGCSYLL